jgi:aconitate hydratase 2 / 2-methylisocitrate dehydratase
MPSHAEYLETVGTKLSDVANIYKYLNFDQMTEYKAALDTLSSGKKVIPIMESA